MTNYVVFQDNPINSKPNILYSATFDAYSVLFSGNVSLRVNLCSGETYFGVGASLSDFIQYEWLRT